VAKTKEAHKALQSQFITHTARKSYIALLDGVIAQPKGTISLPMKLDYDHRPRQMVADDGKSAITEYEVIEVQGSQTRVRFYPITGRTHQLRLHAAHSRGLNAPIVGDDIYGTGHTADCQDGKRLCLHAECLDITHPTTGQTMYFESKAEF
jgi:tRNA pseudouridine32 synthase/23S rRNA pseudouridine746 synthase